MKNKVALKFKRLRQDALLVFCQQVLANLQGNTQFDKIKEIVDGELATAVTTYDEGLKARASGSHAKVAEKNEAKVALLSIMDRVALEVDLIANGDKALILEAGFEVRKHPVRHKGQVGIITDLTAVRTEFPNEAMVKWSKVDAADKYALEYSSDLGKTWHNGTYSSGKRIRMKDLPSRSDIMIRVRGLGAAGKKGPWSEPVSVFVV